MCSHLRVLWEGGLANLAHPHSASSQFNARWLKPQVPWICSRATSPIMVSNKRNGAPWAHWGFGASARVMGLAHRSSSLQPGRNPRVSQQIIPICHQFPLTFLCRTRSLYLHGRGMSLEISSQQQELPAPPQADHPSTRTHTPSAACSLPPAPGSWQPGEPAPPRDTSLSPLPPSARKKRLCCL